MVKGRTLIRVVVAFALVAACDFSARAAERSTAAADLVAAENIRRHTVVLGGDALEGRAPGSRGGRLAAAYLAAELGQIDGEPLGDDGTF